MKKFFLLSVALMLCVFAIAQPQTQKGISYRYNGKNPRTPLPNVTIECVTADNAVISDNTGSFTLMFNTLKMGDRMGLVTVKKREMMVFNQHAVDEWSIRKEPLCLILCDANEFEQQKQNLIAIGREEAQKKYDRQKTELQKQLDASEIDRAKYEIELDKAYEELDRLHKHLDEYADLFARIDESEIDSLAQQAMDLFNQGQVDEAVQLFEQGNYLEKLKASNRTIQQADQLIEAAEHGKAKAEKDREEQLQSLNAQIAAYKMQNEWEKAGALLKGLADELNVWEYLFDYAFFCQNQNTFSESEAYYQKALFFVRQMAKDNKSCESELALILNNLGNLYKSNQRFTESETIYHEAIEIRRRLALSNPEAYNPSLAVTLLNIGLLYSETHQFTESEEAYNEALTIYRKLASDNPNTYDSYLALTLNNIGILYQETRQLTKSETAFNEALKICRQLALDDPQTYEPDLAITLNNIGALFQKTQRITECESVYNEALEIRRRLVLNNPKAYDPDLALTLNNIGSLFYETQHFRESETAFNEALEIRRQLVLNNPQAFESDLAITLNNLGNLYADLQYFSKSEMVYNEALDIRRHLFSINPQVYENYLASTLVNLGLLYSQQKHYQKAILFFEESLLHLKNLSSSNQFFFQYYIDILVDQSYLFVFTGEFIKSEQYAREAILSAPSLLSAYAKLAASLLFQGKYTEAETIYLQYKDEIKDNFLQDLQDFEAAGVIPEERKADVEKIRKLLNE